MTASAGAAKDPRPSDGTADTNGGPPDWPDELARVFDRAVTVEYTSLTRTGRPVMVPVTPYVGLGTLDVSTGLTYPAKAERARRNPRVCLLYSDDVGSGLDRPPVVLVHGLARVRDADLQANTDRYVRLTFAKLPAAMRGTPGFVLGRLGAYFARIWIEVTPTRIWWWESTALDRPPRGWSAPAGATGAPADPEPAGRRPGPWLPTPEDWRPAARRAVARLGHRDLAWCGADGWPYSVPVAEVREEPVGFRVRLGAYLPDKPQGPACLTCHTHTPTFTTQENHSFVGDISPTDDGYLFRVERVLADVSLQGNRVVRTLGFLSKVRRLQSRLEHEARRRGQPVPVVRLP
jgi:hypothetical protein